MTPARDVRVRELSPSARTGLSQELADFLDAGEGYALTCIDWYLRHKGRKRTWCRVLRGLAIVLASAGSLVPLVGSAVSRNAGTWGYVFLAASAACVAFDRFFGLSSGWMRDVSAELDVRRHLLAFQDAWLSLRACGEVDPTSLVNRQVALIAQLRADVQLTVESETRSWMTGFEKRPELPTAEPVAARERDVDPPGPVPMVQRPARIPRG